MVRVLVVGQTPPPYLGQPIMLECLLRSQMRGVELQHLHMVLSKDASQIGQFGWKKFARLFPVILRIIVARIVRRPQVFYFSPGGPNRVSMFRDLAILLSTRWLFEKTVFHFHGSGISELYPQLPRWQRWLFRRAYFHADAAIRLSETTAQDGQRLEARREYIVPNGIGDPCPDILLPSTASPATEERPLRILFVAVLRESKGLMVLIEACGLLAGRGIPFRLEIMGPPHSDEFLARVHARVAELNLEQQIRFLGVLTGPEKLAAFAKADTFCMPTFYENEAFPVALLEASAYGLPIVATRWRGIPSIVDDGQTGFLVAPHDPDAVADRLAELADNTELRLQMGAAARDKFLREFTLARHIERMRQVFLAVAGQVPAEQEVESKEELIAAGTR